MTGGQSPNILNNRLLSSLKEELEIVEKHYADMNYTEALSSALKSRRTAILLIYVGNAASVATYAALIIIVILTVITLGGSRVRSGLFTRITKRCSLSSN